jgi:hypothetical protein
MGVPPIEAQGTDDERWGAIPRHGISGSPTGDETPLEARRREDGDTYPQGDAERPHEIVGRLSLDADPRAMDAVEMMSGARGGAIRAVVRAVPRAEHDVMILEVAARAAARHRAAPAVALEDRVAVAGERLPFLDHASEHPLRGAP